MLKGRQQAFLGIHDLLEKGDWETVLGESLNSIEYVNWFDDNPDNYGGNENCATLVPRGGMNDVDCSSKWSFLCEMPSFCNI